MFFVTFCTSAIHVCFMIRFKVIIYLFSKYLLVSQQFHIFHPQPFTRIYYKNTRCLIRNIYYLSIASKWDHNQPYLGGVCAAYLLSFRLGFFWFLFLVLCSMLPAVSLNCSFLISLLVYSSAYFQQMFVSGFW